MMGVLCWLKDHWYLPLLAGVAILGYLTFRGRVRPWESVERELDVIRAGQKAREAQERLGAERAAEAVRIEHQDALTRLDADQRKEAEALAQDPVALSRYLVRVGGGK